MYKHILITTDGSELAQHGVDHGLALARATGAAVSVLTVTAPFPVMTSVMGEMAYTSAEVFSDYEKSQAEAAGKILGAVEAAAQAQGVSAKVLHIADALPAEAILRAAGEQGCDLICMASHGRRGLKRLLLGSQTAEVVARAEVPVLVVR